MIKEKYEVLKRHSVESNNLVKECLKTALVILAREKSYKDISVTELCKKAGVSRMAFYRNYRITKDIFNEIALDINKEILNSVGSPFRAHTAKEWYIEAFQIIAKNRDAISLMFEEEFLREWMNTVNGLVVHDDSFCEEKTYQRLMWSGGYENAIAHWLKNGMKETPEQMADYCIKYLPHLMEENT